MTAWLEIRSVGGEREAGDISQEDPMRGKWIFITLAGALALPLLVAPIVLAPGREPADTLPAAALDPAEQARMIDAMRPPKRARPAIAIITLNDATEVADLLVAYGILRRADVADVTVVAQRAAPVRLYPPKISIEPEATIHAFDERYPEGADYIVVPAMDPENDPFVMDWISAQLRKGAKIVSICNGARTLAAAGLLDGRRATAHWYSVRQLRKAHPAIQWLEDRRYVTDNGITTSTGVSANIPLMLALVEAIGGRDAAEHVAGEIGAAGWDARHRSSAFQLTGEHKKTFVRNKLSFWRHETIGVPVAGNVDEIALGLTLEAYSRSELARVMTVGNKGEAVRSRHGLTIRPDRPIESAAVDDMLAPPPFDAPAMTMDRELARIASRYDHHTAAIVALAMEYPWAPGYARAAGR
ncbi:MAG: DJ-1/PfpI family protein [Pollutimonas bauzanensis]